MVEINLLPWRAYIHEYNKKQLVHLIIAALLFGLMLSLILYGWLNLCLQAKNQTVLQLQKQLTAMHKKPVQEQHVDTTSIFDLVTKFHNNNAQFSLFFSRLMQLTPEGMTWQAMRAEEKQMLLTGSTTSFQLLLAFVKLFDNNQSSFRADIVKIKSVPHSDSLQFSLRFSGVIPPLSNLIEKQYG
jgi:hypothetical protein